MYNVQLLIKPASGLCNMRCEYCFYEDETSHRSQKNHGFMQDETAAILIDEAFCAAGQDGEVSFSFQGGEPTLAGIDFYRVFLRKAAEQNHYHRPVTWAIQTNGLFIDEDWAELFRENQFLVGVSVDGDRPLHDAARPDAAGDGTYDRVATNVRLLQAKGVDVNLLCVVTGRIARKGRRVYEAMKGLGSRYLQFIPCLEPIGCSRGSSPWSLQAEAYGHFLCDIFDLWQRDWKSGDYVSVRQFDDWVNIAIGMPPGACTSGGACGGYLVVEADGSVYPCDFYALDEWKLGKCEDGFESLTRSERMAEFRRRRASLPEGCGTCPYFALCGGGCPRDWRMADGVLLNELCPAFRMFFDYAWERVHTMAEIERRYLGL